MYKPLYVETASEISGVPKGTSSVLTGFFFSNIMYGSLLLKQSGNYMIWVMC